MAHGAQPIVLREDNHLLVVAKPAGMPTQDDASGDPSLVRWAESYRQRIENKSGKAYVGLIHRLDRVASGIVLLAKTSKAAARLSEQFRSHRVTKTYWAVCAAVGATPSSAIWRDALIKDTQSNVSRVGSGADAKAAETQVRTLATAGAWRLLELRPITGRSHQLRVQCSARGCPIAGDVKYGSALALGHWIALHAAQLAVEHPTTKTNIVASCEPPPSWSRFPFDWRRLTAENLEHQDPAADEQQA